MAIDINVATTVSIDVVIIMVVQIPIQWRKIKINHVDKVDNFEYGNMDNTIYMLLNS